MIKLFLALCLFAAVELASSEKMLKMLEEAGVESDSSQQDPEASSHRDNKKLQASPADAITERQSGDNYPTSCFSNYGAAPAKVLKVIRDAFHIYSGITQRREYIVNNIDNIAGVILVWHGLGKSVWTTAHGNYRCVDFQGYQIWMT